MQNVDIERFREVHTWDYEQALKEVKTGKKQTCWMWYIFPTVRGKWRSRNSLYYSIESIDEAKAFLDDIFLGKNIREISNALLQLNITDPRDIFANEWVGDIDVEKLQASMTLFHYVGEQTDENNVFYLVLEKFFDGQLHTETVEILDRMSGKI